MENYSKVFGILRQSIVSNDFLIFIVAILTGVFCVLSIGFSYFYNKIKGNNKKRDIDTLVRLHNILHFVYTLFVVFISLFPLLGMLGTVVGLLGLDFSANDMDNIKSNFFIALTSTAWGIIFSCVFKIVHAFIMNDIERNIEEMKNIIANQDGKEE